MKKVMGLLAATLLFGLAGSVFALGLPPQVVIDPYDITGLNKVVKFQVTEKNDTSWMYMPLTVLPADYSQITVSFDIYRIRDASVTNDQMAEWLWWAWDGDIVPYYGGQLEGFGYPATTFPFVGAGYTTGTTPTVFDRYVTLNLIWDINNNWISSEYAGGDVDINQTLTSPGTKLNGFWISLDHISSLAEVDIAYIDNFVITGSDIYNSDGFQNFALGNLNGQGGWQAGNEATAVPEPATMLLIGSGLIGLAGLRKKFKK